MPVAPRDVVGCWSVEPGRFSVVDKLPADPGQTILPKFVQLDTLPAAEFMGQRMGLRLHGIPGKNTTRYADGYYEFSRRDSITMGWTNGFVGITFRLRAGASTMRGLANAWTDYGGQERASISLRRISCSDTSRNEIL